MWPATGSPDRYSATGSPGNDARRPEGLRVWGPAADGQTGSDLPRATAFDKSESMDSVVVKSTQASVMLCP